LADNSLKAGSKLGRFQLLIPIGSGGMGRVWVAREEHTRRLFAIKTTLADEQTAGEFWNVLLDEARLAAQVQHRSVCTIHAFEVDEKRGVPYLVMDFSDGGSLHELLVACPDRRIDPVVAASIALSICDGLQVAHDLTDEQGVQLGVVHRDVSPQNILISAGGHVQLTDFGVAKARGRVHAATVTGEIKGKLSYMAPEQVTTRDIDRRADIFALGCVLYEATVGQRPFHGDDAVSTLYQLLEEPLVLPSTRFSGYPSSLEEIIVKALQREPVDRYQSAEEFGNALSIWIAAQGRLINERDVARLMNDHLGQPIAERARRIAAAEVEIDTPPSAATPTELTLGGSAANALSLNQAARARRSRVKWSLAATAACALVLVGWFGLRRAGTEAGPALASGVVKAEPSLSGAPVASTPATDKTITITLRAEPAQAVLFLDDGAALPNPYKLAVPPDAGVHHVRAAAAGYSERVEEVRFDHGQEIAISLPMIAGDARPRSGPGKSSNLSVPSAHTASPAALHTGELPPVVKKPPRTLDPDNPFASP
jgi:eukaryotic-like serine/threonine-protein kinase